MRDIVDLPDSRLRLEVWQHGTGQPLLYLHGFEGPLGEAPFLRALADKHQVCAPVHPGFDGSAGGADCYGMLDAVLLYQELLERLALIRPIVIGHSLGGMFAAELAAASPQLLDRLVLIAPFGLWLEARPIPDFLPLDEAELAQLTWADPARRKAETSKPAISADAARPVSKPERMSNLAAAANYLWPVPDRGLSRRLARIKVPTLLVWGEADKLMGLNYAKEFQSRLPNAALSVIEGAGHFPMLEQEDSFLQALRAFLAKP